MLAEAPVTQRSPCYSAVSASLTNPLLDCFNYSPFCHTHYFILPRLAGQTLYQAALLETNTSLLQRFIAESSREVMSSEEYRSALNNKHRQVVMFLFLFFKLSPQVPFVSFSFLSISLLSMLPFSLSQSSLFSLSLINSLSS